MLGHLDVAAPTLLLHHRQGMPGLSNLQLRAFLSRTKAPRYLVITPSPLPLADQGALPSYHPCYSAFLSRTKARLEAKTLPLILPLTLTLILTLTLTLSLHPNPNPKS